MLSGIYIMDLEEDDAGSNSDSDGSPKVSIHAMTGIHAGDTMLLNTSVRGAARRPHRLGLDALLHVRHHHRASRPAADAATGAYGWRRQWQPRALRRSLLQHRHIHRWRSLLRRHLHYPIGGIRAGLGVPMATHPGTRVVGLQAEDNGSGEMLIESTGRAWARRRRPCCPR